MAQFVDGQIVSKPFKKISANTINATVVNAGPCVLDGVDFFTNAANIGYLKIFDQVTVPNPAGGDVPVVTIMTPGVAGGSGALDQMVRGMVLRNGLAIAMTGGVADNDATAVAANAFVANIRYH